MNKQIFSDNTKVKKFDFIFAALIGLIFSLINVLPVLFRDDIVQDDFRQSFFLGLEILGSNAFS